MKTILISLIICAAVSSSAQTIAKGKIYVPDSVRITESFLFGDTVAVPGSILVLIEQVDNDGTEWIEWPFWFHYEPYEYWIKIPDRDQLNVMFLDPCTSEVYATLTVYAGHSRQKIKKSIKLNGEHYQIGAPIERIDFTADDYNITPKIKY